MIGPHGIHHVTCIAGDAQENLDFYSGVLGMRLVKRSVNQDDPTTYHLFYADAEGHAGTDLTFFPWSHLPPGRAGTGLTVETALAVPPASLDYWRSRLETAGTTIASLTERYGERALPLRDPHGLHLVLVETSDEREFSPWEESPVPVEHQIQGLHGVRLWERDLNVTREFLLQGMGFELADGSGEWHRFALTGGGSGRWLEVREIPGGARGMWGPGSVHHVAWRVEDDLAQLDLRQRVIDAGVHPTEVIDRFWFHSVYFRELGGALFEIATDGPGFTRDEDLESLGEKLILPPWLEDRRTEIERALPPLREPS